ncbi:hypothetical protein FUD75_08730, partial [Campylobacter jejuni]|nr:hypothetical protein [Campylobacter jejuni]ECP6261545.1 hypothetical protein [Campylobacter jejuni]
KINKFICIIGFILILILGFLDLYQVIKRVNFAKIYNLLIFFGLYYIAEFFSRHIIYTTVNYMPDSYNYAINIFNIIHIILIITILTTFILLLIIAVSLLIYMLPNLLKIIFLNLDFLTQKPIDYIIQKTHFKNRTHIFCSIFYGILSIFYFLFFLMFGYFQILNIASSIIHMTSYYQNNTICSKVSPNAYIHLLGDNKVSISPFNEKFAFHLDKNTLYKFMTKDCN